MTTFFLVLIYIGGFCRFKQKGRGFLDAFIWPAVLGWAIADWAERLDPDNVNSGQTDTTPAKSAVP
jgi:hypothetical protein